MFDASSTGSRDEKKKTTDNVQTSPGLLAKNGSASIRSDPGGRLSPIETSPQKGLVRLGSKSILPVSRQPSLLAKDNKLSARLNDGWLSGRLDESQPMNSQQHTSITSDFVRSMAVSHNVTLPQKNYQ